jgi:hypothetical protein
MADGQEDVVMGQEEEVPQQQEQEEVECVLDDKPQRVRWWVALRSRRAAMRNDACPLHAPCSCVLLKDSSSSSSSSNPLPTPRLPLHTPPWPPRNCAPPPQLQTLTHAQVVDGLYIGSAWSEMNAAALTKAGITDILQVGGGLGLGRVVRTHPPTPS